MSNPIKVLASIESINQLGDIIFVRLKVPPRATRFKAGQFLHLTLDEFDPTEGYWPESRFFPLPPNLKKSTWKLYIV
jgi:NAD(P)H-flavin reductase